jgi:uncharacterized protein
MNHPATSATTLAPTAEAVVRQIYAHVAEADFAAATALMADDVTVTQAEALPFGGRWRGKQAFAEMAERIVAAWPGFTVRPVAFLADGGERVAVLAQLRGDGLAMDMLELWTVREGRVVACQPFYFDTAAAASAARRA